jgi:glycosyltransferase involved in cell wall biosynthesis
MAGRLMTLDRPLTVAWFSYFPVAWLPDVPDEVRRLRRLHPASWQRVLLGELEKVPNLHLHILILRKWFERSLTFERHGVTFHLIKTIGGTRAPSLFWMDTLLIWQRLRKIKPDVVHAWGTEQGAALVASRLKYPYVVTMQGLATWISERVPRKWYERLAAILERWSVPRAPCVTTESNFAVQYLRTRLGCSNVHQVEHAPDWIFHRLERRPQLSPFRFVFVGTPSYLKGTDLLVKALDRLRAELRFELIVVGNAVAGFMNELRASVSPELWQRIQFRRDLPAAEVAQELSVATMVLYPTRVDTSPNSVKEAAVGAVPVVASDVGGIPDYVIPGQNGILFRTGDLEELVGAIRAACQHRLFGRGQVDPTVLPRIREYLSPALMAKRFMEVYADARQQGR